ncbi:DUF3761 domain-containing protein [Kitasatospora sp. NPDC092948]|uniref:DUF3761 domain-containing protein n=1 Tax=Kitasatospora sp. NPDC092948 TaxID=3364088 RepID=UPI00380BADA6
MKNKWTFRGRQLPESLGRKLGAGLVAAAAVLWVSGCEPAEGGTAQAVPDVVGMHGDKAKDALKSAKDVTLLDVKAGGSSPRSVIVKSNWKVCSQEPAAGAPSVKNLTVKLSVVKNEEDCPGAAPETPAPETPAATTEAPAPSAAPSTQAPTQAPVEAPAADARSTPPAPADTPHPTGSCKAHTVGYCGWDRGETPEQPGETAVCKDGSISMSASAGSGTCSGHGGVRVWFK